MDKYEALTHLFWACAVVGTIASMSSCASNQSKHNVQLETNYMKYCEKKVIGSSLSSPQWVCDGKKGKQFNEALQEHIKDKDAYK
jgi:hypothetical protein